MNCNWGNRDKAIEDYVSGVLSKADAETFEEHCFECDACFAELRLFEDTADLVREEGNFIFAPYLKMSGSGKIRFKHSIIQKVSIPFKTFRPRWALVSLSAAIALICVIILHNSSLSDRQIDNFKPLPYLGAMINDGSRSWEINVLSPEIGEKLTGDIAFHWEETDQEIVFLIILDNKGMEKFRSKPDGTSLLFSNNLDPGLYYWKLESEEDLLYLGSFVIPSD